MNSKLLLTIMLLVFYSCNNLSAQKKLNIDSLSNGLRKEKNDTATLKRYISYIENLPADKRNEIEITANWIIEHAVLQKERNLEMAASVVLANNYLSLDKLKEAADLYGKVIVLGEKKEDSYPYLSKAYIGMYNYYKQTGAYDKAKEFIEKNLQLSQKYNYKAGIAKSKYGLSAILDDHSFPAQKDTFYLRLNLINEAGSIWNELKDTAQMYRVNIGLAETLAEYEYFDSAIFVLESKKHYLTDLYNQKFAAQYYFTLGKIYNQKAGYFDEKKEFHLLAIANFLVSIDLAKQYNNNKVLLWGYKWLASSYKFIDDYKNAYKYKNLYSNLNDSILDDSYLQSMASAQHKYEVEKKGNEIIKLDSENKQKSALNKILTGGTVSLLLIGLLGYRNFKSKQTAALQQQTLQQQQITQLEKDKQLLAIDAMLKGQEEERSRLAKDLHDGLGGMLSGVKLSFVNMKENLILDAESVTSFEKSILQLDNTIAELRKVAHNLMPEALVKFGLKNALLDFCNSMQLSGKTKIIFEQMGTERQLSNTADLYIYRIMQELINNAVKHGAPNQILVQLTKTPNKVLLTVEDDGKGFDKQILPSAGGIGMKSLQQRVDYFKGKIDIASQPGEGTSVNIELIV